MKNWLKIFSVSVLFSISSFAHAIMIDFMADADGAIGESAWTELIYADLGNITGLSLTVTATHNGSAALAYLDANSAGLGVCKSAPVDKTDVKYPGSGNNVCDNPSDDNVTADEVLMFTFSYFGENIAAPDGITIFINDNHGTGDNKGLMGGDFITFNGSDMEVPADTLVWEVNLGSASEYTTAYKDSPFYVQKLMIDVATFRGNCTTDNPESCVPEVPEPSSLSILALCAILLAARKKKLI
ncbi:hypothetical protein [Thalassomonas sp. M1454]|uniref:hypothetical protein n=1 Tax=Thalassomonas sp. M1454 TaxID=2594477 RepID=UPI00117CB7D5|nr:hypothetical protein [Thalassomonas sp. M1454]TRX57432.1 hypothetical protein FNN08_08025 [Thalassomonas sp. M1454]